MEKNTQAPPRPAATVILLRPFHSRLQVYLLKRSGKSKFFPGAYVFPGGAVDNDDLDSGYWKDHIDMDIADVSRRFGGEGITGEDILGYCVAGIRETFEEAGVLLAGSGSGPSPEQIYIARETQSLESGWLRKLTSSGELVLNLGTLSRWAHWITPEKMKYHYDTLFFIALMPQGQRCMPDRKETDEGIWISPGEALAYNLKGLIPLSPPTIVTMHELLNYPYFDSLMEARDAGTWGDARLPRMITSNNGPVIIEPWDPLYGDAFEEIDATGFESMVHPGYETFSRVWLHDGIWKPIRTD